MKKLKYKKTEKQEKAELEQAVQSAEADYFDSENLQEWVSRWRFDRLVNRFENIAA